MAQGGYVQIAIKVDRACGDTTHCEAVLLKTANPSEGGDAKLRAQKKGG